MGKSEVISSQICNPVGEEMNVKDISFESGNIWNAELKANKEGIRVF